MGSTCLRRERKSLTADWSVWWDRLYPEWLVGSKVAMLMPLLLPGEWAMPTSATLASSQMRITGLFRSRVYIVKGNPVTPLLGNLDARLPPWYACTHMQRAWGISKNKKSLGMCGSSSLDTVWVELDDIQSSHNSVVLWNVLTIILYQKDVSSFEGKEAVLDFLVRYAFERARRIWFP